MNSNLLFPSCNLAFNLVDEPNVLWQIGQHFKDGYLHKDEFKIVYVAPMKVGLLLLMFIFTLSSHFLLFPMKALAAEVTSTFSHRLSPLNVAVKELTGDMQLSKSELEETQVALYSYEIWFVMLGQHGDYNFLLCCLSSILNQMIVTTPEKWDVITRKSSDMSLSKLVKLLIIDEVHLLNDDRGPVIEALVARTLRQVSFSCIKSVLLTYSFTLL